MKAKIIVLLIAFYAMSACSTGSSMTYSGNSHYSAGSYYGIQEAKIDYVDSNKGIIEEKENIDFVSSSYWLDTIFFVFNIFYYPFTGETIFGTISKHKQSPEYFFEKRIQSLESSGLFTGLVDPNESAEIRPIDPDQELDPFLERRIQGDIILMPLNLFVYSFTGDSIFGSIQILKQSRKLSSRAEKARSVLSKATVEKVIPAEEVDYLNPSNLLNAYISYMTFFIPGIGENTEDKYAEAKALKPYFTSDKIMNRFDAETFGQLLTDANLVLDDLDLSVEDVEELKQNGYLDFVEDDAKSIPTFDAAPVKGKKK
ncbi:hypothetical protein [Leptospira ainazelensis]|uniref:hypothetical protein n=1 Tax=Leptospira ainazelensis TaxID=2810034 RepID=UPI001E63110C|nr:hypothetical protein [Leptospira ainazelensis]